MNPRQIGKYDINGQLGSGAAGIVFEGLDPETNRRVAIKLLGPQMLEDEVVQKRFIREMAILQSMDHENVVTLYDAGVHEGHFYYAMEHIDFGALSVVLAANDCLSWREACECGLQICAALQVAHEQGVVHRDLKPGNVFLSKEGKLKLGDFGLAYQTNSQRLTTVDLAVGTGAYMAPEQFRSSAEITPQTDLYALGCLLFLMITGESPFLGETSFQLYQLHSQAPRPDLKTRVPDCPEELSDLVHRLMAIDPAERPTSAEAVGNQIREILAKHGLPPGQREQDNLYERLTDPTGQSLDNVSWPTLLTIGAIILLVITATAVLMGQ